MEIKHAHMNGIVHRDIKPENILFIKNEDGNLYPAVSDFGLGVLINRDSPSITRSERFLGTYEYVAPEQYRDAKNVDVRADIFSLGKIFYEILTGKTPYPDIEYDKIPSKYHYIIRNACQNDPKKRYNKIEEMINDIEAL